jgi:hypothetical protein
MIKITSFYPFSNLMRVTQEFYEDKVDVKTKSLVSERNFSFSYTEVAEISCAKYRLSNQWMWGFGLIGLAFWILLMLDLLSFNQSVYTTAKVIYILGLIIYLISFAKKKIYYFSDKNDNVITSIIWSNKNKEKISQVVELTKNKSEHVSILTIDNPFPKKEPIYELVNYDVPNYFNKSVARYYEDEIIEVNTALNGDNVLRIKYLELRKNFRRGKSGNEEWLSVFWEIMAFAGVFAGLHIFLDLFSNKVFLFFVYILGVTAVITIILRFVKQEMVGFANINGNGGYWTWVSKSNKDKIEKIIEFIQSKIPAEGND